jgi:hypothetical protein
MYEPFGEKLKAMQKVDLCLRQYINANEFVERHTESLSALCHYVLKDDEKLADVFRKVVIA